MAIKNLTVEVEARPRPWWRPLGLRSFRRWYREARGSHGRCLSALSAFTVARYEFFVGAKKVTS